MELAKISATRKNTGLCVGGWHRYLDKKQTIPKSYALKVLTPNPTVFLYVEVPVTKKILDKARILKQKCIHSEYNMIEVKFDNFKFDYHTEKIVDGILKTTKYVASATDFHFVEED